MHAELCRALANPKRLMIVAILGKAELSVSEIAATLGVSTANISQHLRLLKDREIVQTRKNGQAVYYSLTDHRMIDACNTLRSVLLDKMKAMGKIAIDFDQDTMVFPDQ